MNIERLQQAIAIIGAINDKQLSLQLWQQRPSIYVGYAQYQDEVTCGTLACAAGWLSLHPDMQAQGLHASPDGSPMVHDTQNAYFKYGFSALAQFFDTTDGVTEELFGARAFFEKRGSFESLTDKEVWLKRAECLMEEYKGQA